MFKTFTKNKITTIILTLVAFAFCAKNALGYGDFKVFLEAAKIIRADGNPYNNWILVSGDNYCLYFYSPLWAIMLIPFSYLPNFVPNFIWLVANVFFLYRIWNLLKSYVNVDVLSSKQIKLILLLTALMSIRFILYNFVMIQMTIFLLWSMLESIRLFNENKVFWGSLVLALAINIKILPIVILPYLVYRNNLKAVVNVLLISLLLLIIPAIFVGWTKNMFLLTQWWSAINPSNSGHLIETDLGPHSLTALVPTLLTETEGQINIDRNILSLSKDSTILISNLVRLFFVLFTIYLLKLPPFKKVDSKIVLLHEISYIILIIPLIFPHMQKYAFVLAIPAMFYLSHFIVNNLKFRKNIIKEIRWYAILVLVALSFVLMTISTDGVIGRNLNEVTQHFKTITWGAVLMVTSLTLASPILTIKINKIKFPI